MTTNSRAPVAVLPRLAVIAALLSFCSRATSATPAIERRFADRPVAWEEHDDADVATPPAPNHLQILEVALTIRDSAANEADRILSLEGDTPAEDVNALDEVPCSTWYCARHNLHPMTPAELAAGPPLRAPLPPLTVMKGKDMGSASGFQVKDARGNRYMLKFDVAGHLGLANTGEMVGSRIFHAAGYNVPGAFLPSTDSQTMGEVMSSLNEGIGEVRALSRGLRDRLDAVVTPEVARDLGRLTRAAAEGAEALQHGDGLAHALLYDRELAVAARSVARNAGRSTADLASAMARIDRIAAAVEAGGGTLHRLVTRDDAGPILEDAQRAARELAEAATAIRHRPGPLHTLVYGPDADELVGNLTALSRTLKRVGDDVAAGKGTVGGLLEDPTVYEDLKIVLRGVKRNTLLKSLVRFTIERDRLRQDGGPIAR